MLQESVTQEIQQGSGSKRELKGLMIREWKGIILASDNGVNESSELQM